MKSHFGHLTCSQFVPYFVAKLPTWPVAEVPTNFNGHWAPFQRVFILDSIADLPTNLDIFRPTLSPNSKPFYHEIGTRFTIK